MSRRLLPLALSALAFACRAQSDAQLVVREGEGGAGGAAPLSISATWTYRSSDVDIDASLLTEHDGGGCQTTGHLVINKALAKADVYTTDAFPCTELAVTEAGDLLLYEAPTGHDWTSEPLRVDRDHEILSLGPWSPATEPAAGFRFDLSAPACGPCTCPQIVGRHAGVEARLILDRDCD